MNTKLFLPLVLALPMVASCDKAADAANNAQNAVENLDLSKMTPDAIKEKGGEMISGLADKLKNVTDVAGATELAKNWMPKLDDLSKMKDKLGAALPNMDALKGAVDALKTKFAGNEGIMNALKPLLEKIQSMMG